MPASRQSRNVLIVDDDVTLSSSAKALLETHDYCVETVSSKYDIQDQLTTNRSDVILINLDSSGPTAFKLLNNLIFLESYSTLVLTISAESGLRPDDIFPRQNIKVLTHPIAPTDLIAAVGATP